jgi:hypothetical protein
VVSNKSAKVVLAIIGTVVLLITAIFLYNQMGQKILRQSLDYLLSERLSFGYVVKKENLAHGPDLAGYWWLRLDGKSKNTAILDPRFDMADEADLAYYRKLFQKRLSLGEVLGGYELYRGELPMGHGSICEISPCNVEILFKVGEENVYVGISKN